MKYVKSLGLLAVAVAALMAFGGTASAITITSPTGTVLSPGADVTIHAESEENAGLGTKHVRIHNNIAKGDCESTFTLTYSENAGGVAKGQVDNLSFTCTSPWTVHVESSGTFEVAWTTGYNGTLTSKGMTITGTHPLGVKCIYATGAAGTRVGTITGGNPATIDLEWILPREGGSPVCGGATVQVTGSYKTTNAYYIDS